MYSYMVNHGELPQKSNRKGLYALSLGEKNVYDV